MSQQLTIDSLTKKAEEIVVTGENKDEFKELTCTICLSDVSEDDVLSKLQCAHIFHLDCIKLWIVRQPTCPNCRVNPITG